MFYDSDPNIYAFYWDNACLNDKGTREAFQKRGQCETLVQKKEHSQCQWFRKNKIQKKVYREETPDHSRAPDHVCIQLLWQVLMSFDRVPFLGLEDREYILRRILLLLEWILRALFLLTKEMFSFLFPHSRLKKSIIKITHRSARAEPRWKSRLDRLSFIGFPHRIKHSDASLIYHCYRKLFVYLLLFFRVSFSAVSRSNTASFSGFTAVWCSAARQWNICWE